MLRTDIKEIDYAFVFITLFKEIQVLSKFKTINEKDVEDSLSKYNRSLIKSAFILTIKQGRSNIFEFTMANHHQEEFSSDEDNAGQEDINNHRSIIQEQDFLYQSMLN